MPPCQGGGREFEPRLPLQIGFRAEVAEQADAMVSKTIGGQLSCRFDPDLRQYVWIADLCSGSTADFESVCPGSSPGSAASNLKLNKPLERYMLQGLCFSD